MTSKTKQLEIPDKYYKIIKDRVKISKKSDHTYRIYENLYKLIGIQEEDRYISFYFRNLFDNEEKLQEIRCRKFIDLVIYDSFIGAKYILTKEQRKLYESNYNKYYYEKKTVEKREKEKEKNVRVCVMCGKVFHPLGNQLTCSPECKKKRSEIKRKTYALEHKEEIKERNRKLLYLEERFIEEKVNL